jgi:hypothetical protein
MSLARCAACTGYLPALAAACPHCEAAVASPARSTARRLLDLAGGGAIALTLAACYGAPPGYYDVDHPTSGCDPSRDVDGDGYCDDDCDQADASIHPGASDPPGDGVDQNCDGFDGPPGPPDAAPAAVVVEPGDAQP